MIILLFERELKVYCWSQVVTEERSGIDDCMSGEMGRHLFQLFTLTSVVWFVLRYQHKQYFPSNVNCLLLSERHGQNIECCLL